MSIAALILYLCLNFVDRNKNAILESLTLWLDRRICCLIDVIFAGRGMFAWQRLTLTHTSVQVQNRRFATHIQEFAARIGRHSRYHSIIHNVSSVTKTVQSTENISFLAAHTNWWRQSIMVREKMMKKMTVFCDVLYWLLSVQLFVTDVHILSFWFSYY